MTKKNIVQETVWEIELFLHGGTHGFTPMEYEHIYKIVERLVEKTRGVSMKCDNCGLTAYSLKTPHA